MAELYIAGGQQRRGAAWQDEWHHYERALLVRLDTESGRAERVLEYVTPDDACAASDEPGILFKAGTRRGDTLVLCTQTEVMSVALPECRRERYLSLPCFNDVHHVHPTDRGTLLVACTGLDLVVETTWEGEIRNEWAVLGGDPWERFSRDTDYRKVVTTKPHASHPNYVFELGGEVWVTRHHQHDAISLTGEGRMDVAVEKPHDGLVHAGKVYFTTVDGHVVAFDAETRERREVVDLSRLCDLPSDTVLGWCRGLALTDDGRMWVGFSRLRQTALRRNLSWVKSRITGRDVPKSLPTRVACFDLAQQRLVEEHDLEAVGLSAVFSIHP